MAQQVKNPPAVQEMQETWVRFLGWEDPLEEYMATHSSILAWRIPCSGGLQSMGPQRIGHNWSYWAVAAAADLVQFPAHYSLWHNFAMGMIFLTYRLQRASEKLKAQPRGSLQVKMRYNPTFLPLHYIVLKTWQRDIEINSHRKQQHIN